MRGAAPCLDPSLLRYMNFEVMLTNEGNVIDAVKRKWDPCHARGGKHGCACIAHAVNGSIVLC